MCPHWIEKEYERDWTKRKSRRQNGLTIVSLFLGSIALLCLCDPGAYHAVNMKAVYSMPEGNVSLVSWMCSARVESMDPSSMFAEPLEKCSTVLTHLSDRQILYGTASGLPLALPRPRPNVFQSFRGYGMSAWKAMIVAVSTAIFALLLCAEFSLPLSPCLIFGG